MPRLECPRCEGKGYIVVKGMYEDGIFQRVTCPECNGTGLLPTVFTGERR